MDRKSIARFQKALQARHSELRQGLAQTQRESLNAQHDHGKDEGDRANTSLALELDLGQKSCDRALLASVDVALKRINEGTFGLCLNCEQEINAKRLEAIPWVRYCITFQELMDRTNSALMAGDSLYFGSARRLVDNGSVWRFHGRLAHWDAHTQLPLLPVMPTPREGLDDGFFHFPRNPRVSFPSTHY